jgi:hypothetical protein
VTGLPPFQVTHGVCCPSGREGCVGNPEVGPVCCDEGVPCQEVEFFGGTFVGACCPSGREMCAVSGFGPVCCGAGEACAGEAPLVGCCPLGQTVCGSNDQGEVVCCAPQG